QEVMGSYHNLFGQPDEAHVIIDTDGRYHIKKIVQGSRVREMIAFARYDRNQAWENFARMTRGRVAAGLMAQEEADALVEQYESDINRYTYLE
ncbi:MAG TPA: arginine decarboxylase, partial [Blastocatellia bacterium]|nr:arginine decarboxylase [Blastocatellia bacterium]